MLSNPPSFVDQRYKLQQLQVSVPALGDGQVIPHGGARRVGLGKNQMRRLQHSDPYADPEDTRGVQEP